MLASPEKQGGSRRRIWLAVLALGWAPLAVDAGPATDAGKLRPTKAPAGYFQMLSPAFDIQSDVSQAYLNTLARQVYKAEVRMYKLFRLSPGFLRGNDPKSKLDRRYPIRGDTLSRWGYKPWIEVRVYKKFEQYADEYFNESDRLFSLVNKTKIRKETPRQRAMRRLTEGVPGAYYMRIHDYDGKYMLRRIRCYRGSKTPEELEGDLLHEMGHLFLETFLMEFAGAPKKGREDQKRGTPAWIGEGVAQLFEVNWSHSRVSQKKKRRYDAFIYEAIKAGDSYPFQKFINITNAHNLQDVAGHPLQATINYAQSYSVMQYMVSVKWNAFLTFLENCRWENYQKQRRGRGRISELYSIQNKAFKDAFNGVSIVQVEEYWKKYVLDEMKKKLKQDPVMYYWCGEYHLRKKDLATAKERFEQAVAGAPKKGAGYLGLGRVALMKNEHKSALENLAKAAQLSPEEEDVFYYLGWAQMRNGQAEAAVKSFRKAATLYPRFYQALDGLGDAYFNTRKFKQAGEAYAQAFQVSKHPQYLFKMGRAAFFAKDYDEAQKNFAAYANVFKRDPRGKFWYGMAAWRLGQKDYAAKKFQEALKLNPRDGNIKLALQRIRKGQMLYFSGESKKPKSVVKKTPSTGKPPSGGKKPAEEEEEE